MAEIIYQQPISEVLPSRFLQYSQSVIQDRAIPDAFDGCKPIHRRVLMAMHDLNLYPNGPYKKSAKTVGVIISTYSPHGDQSAYEALVGMAQDFNMRYPLVDGSGNFGSVNQDPAAAMRYTECRLSPFGELMLRDVEKLADFKDNFDNSAKEPVTLTSYWPELLCNPQQGIASGLATKFAPHYAKDVYTAILKVIKDEIKGEDTPIDSIIDIIKAPDFPTGGTIINGADVRKIYKTGTGPVTIRSKYRIENNSIIYYEIPYKVTPKSIIQSIAELEIPDIKDVRDETSLSGIRIVVELKKDANSEWIINKLFRDTALQSNYSINMTAILNNRPVQNLDIKQLIRYYLEKLCTVHEKSINIEIDELNRKIFINNTMLKAISLIDDIVKIVRNEENPIEKMIETLGFTKEEAEYIFNIKLSSISKASYDDLKVKEENYKNEKVRLETILLNSSNFLNDLYNKLKEIRDSKLLKNDVRRTEITNIQSKDNK